MQFIALMSDRDSNFFARTYFYARSTLRKFSISILHSEWADTIPKLDQNGRWVDWMGVGSKVVIPGMCIKRNIKEYLVPTKVNSFEVFFLHFFLENCLCDHIKLGNPFFSQKLFQVFFYPNNLWTDIPKSEDRCYIKYSWHF